MDEIRMQREELYRLRKDLEAALREVKHQAELAVRLTIWMCGNGFAQEAADIVGVEAATAIQNKLLTKDPQANFYD